MIPYSQTMHSVPEAAKQPQNIFEPPPYLTICRILFFVGLILFSVNSRMACFAKKLYLSLICPQNILPEGLRLTQICSCKVQSGFFMPPCQKCLIQMTTYGSSGHRCTPSLQDSLNLCGSWLTLFIHHSNYPALHSFINFFLFRPRPGRFATVPWVINFLIILRTVDKGTLRSLEIDL